MGFGDEEVSFSPIDSGPNSGSSFVRFGSGCGILSASRFILTSNFGQKGRAHSLVMEPTGIVFQRIKITRAEEPQEEMTLLRRVQTQFKSPVAVHRLLLARKIPQLVEQIGFADSSVHIIPILEEMTEDPEAGVRQSLCEQLGALGVYFNKVYKLDHRK